MKILTFKDEFVTSKNEEEVLSCLQKLYFRSTGLENNNALNNSLNPEIFKFYFTGNWDFNILKLERVVCSFGINNKLTHAVLQPMQIEIKYHGDGDIKVSVGIFYTLRHYTGHLLLLLFCISLFSWFILFGTNFFILLILLPFILLAEAFIFSIKAKYYFKLIKESIVN